LYRMYQMMHWRWLPVVRRGDRFRSSTHQAGPLVELSVVRMGDFAGNPVTFAVLAIAAPVTHNLGVCDEH